MNPTIDIHQLTRVVPVAPENVAYERGWWPVVAFTDDVRPVVLELNVN